MATVEQALALAAQGFHVFPVIEGQKLPAIEAWQNRATTDPEQIRRWWLDPVMGWDQGFNIGICTTRYGADEALLVVDVDNKNGKRGDDELITLELAGCTFPVTRTQSTPTGGRHLVYRCARPVRQGADVLGSGLDIRSRGGFIVGAGSEVDAGTYVMDAAPVGLAPDWLVAKCGEAREESPLPAVQALDVNPDAAHQRAVHYLQHEAPVALEGDAGDQTTFMVAARVKDLGVGEVDCADLMWWNWNERCSPPWDFVELREKVRNAYRYGKDPIGVSAPEAQFPALAQEEAPAPDAKGHPFDELNKQYAFVVAGGTHHILWETRDSRGVWLLEHLGEGTFHKKHASKSITEGRKSVPLTEAWMRWPGRRSYDGLCFMPGEQAPANFYNLWRGFTVDPASTGAHWSVDMFREHALKNVCRGDKALCKWLLGYFAHMVQRPFEKPLTALVFRGGKGTGKNSLVERVGYLLGHHFMVTSKRRFLTSNFNSHMENMLCFVLDEAFWSGDKEAEGILKDLITGQQHTIEHKGAGIFTVDNRTRVVIIGNEEWVVPASHDERRFAVFDVGDGRKQDREFFRRMRVGMEEGGYAHLLRFLLDYPLAGIDLNEAPMTDALLDQKHAALEPIAQWWLDCLSEGRIEGGDFDGWPDVLEKARLRDALHRYLKARNVRTRAPDERTIGRQFKRMAPSVESARPMVGGVYRHQYKLPDLEAARKDWEAFVGQPVTWEG